MTGSFIVIGENIHATRVIRHPSPRLVDDPTGHPSVDFTDEQGDQRLLPIPQQERSTQDYEEGRVKHVRSALRLAKDGHEVGVAYLRQLAFEQIQAGAAYLDINVDEYSPNLNEQIEMMRYLVDLLSPIVSVPLSIDSSNLEIIEAGLAAASPHAGPPLLNSASLERTNALDLVEETKGPVIVTAAGNAAMPANSQERVDNATRMVEAAAERGIPHDMIYVDPLMFPISVDGNFGRHVLDAITTIRSRYGSEIHITGGMSNVSFGLPHRRLINDTFLRLAIDAGADSGILDPVQIDLSAIRAIDRETRQFQLALDVLSGTDRHCRAYIRAFRAGQLETTTARSPIR